MTAFKVDFLVSDLKVLSPGNWLHNEVIQCNYLFVLNAMVKRCYMIVHAPL